MLLLILLLLAAPDDPWSRLRSRNPPGTQFSLRLLEPHPYRRGELVRMELKTPAAPPFVPGQPPPAARWQFGGFLLDPPASCGSLRAPCFLITPMDRFDPMLSFGERAEPVVFPLNAYLPALAPAPGHYRTALLAKKLVLTSRGPMSVTYGYANPPQDAISNTVEFDVVPASPAWITGTVAESVARLKGPEPRNREEYEKRGMAAQQLRFLDHPAAWRVSLELLPVEEYILLRGLSASSEPARVCELMQARLPLPEQTVSSGYLATMARVCGKEVVESAAARLAASLEQKQPGPKAAAFATLIERVQQAKYVQQPAPDWTPALTREFVHSFPALNVGTERYLLESYAAAIRSPELTPLFESVLDRWKPGDYYEAAHAALRALFRADPARAQARIRAELVKPRTWLDTPELDMLPASAVPPMDDALIEALAAAQRAGGWNVPLRMAALAKYASPRAEPRIKAIFESQQDPCQPELMAYFLRVDPAYAGQVFHRTVWDMQAPPPPCTVQYFQRTPPLAMHPFLEKYMAAFLMHRDVAVKTAAAHSLGLYGSKTALPPLWGAFRYFHEYWKDKLAELPWGGEGVSLEVELRNAIARGRRWLATETDLRTIESLCISEQCVYETQQDLRAWKPLRLEISDQGDAIRGAVAQYYGLDVATLKLKLAQFSPGTEFVLSAWGANAQTAAADIREFAASHGLILTASR